MGNALGKLDEHARTVIERPQRPPVRPVTLDRVAEIKTSWVKAGRNGRSPFRLDLRLPQRDQLVLWVKVRMSSSSAASSGETMKRK